MSVQIGPWAVSRASGKDSVDRGTSHPQGTADNAHFRYVCTDSNIASHTLGSFGY